MRAKWWTLRLLILAAAAMSITTMSAVSADDQLSPFRSKLTAGPYEAGFETVEMYDYSRVSRDKYDYDGNPREGETARPIQICVWYPAALTADAVPMVYGEYAFPAPRDSRFYPLLSALQAREIGFLAAPLGGNRTMVLDMMNLPVAAFKNAPRVEGSFPLIIYHPDAGGSYAENAALCEALASNGFVVASSHNFGTTDIPVMMNHTDLETAIRDREFVYGFMRDYPNVDFAKVGLVGTGLGGLSAMLMQMRNTDIEAVVSLDGIEAHRSGAELGLTFPSYDVTRMDVPLMQAHDSNQDDLDMRVMDSLEYSHRMLLAFGGRDRIQFTQYATAAALLADTTGESLQPTLEFYESICRCVLDFLDLHLHGKDISTTIFAKLSKNEYPELGEVIYASKEGQRPPPTEAQFVEMIQENKIDRAVEIYEAFKKSRPGYVFFQEGTMNAVGYRLLQTNQLEQARMIFKINTEAFPNSANVWDSFADACIANDDTETAIMCYEKVLEVLPSDSALTAAVREILMNNATQGLEQLKK